MHRTRSDRSAAVLGFLIALAGSAVVVCLLVLAALTLLGLA